MPGEDSIIVCAPCAQLLAFEDMGVRMEDLMQYANAEVCT